MPEFNIRLSCRWLIVSGQRGTRTLMAVRPQVFETCASTGSAICPDLKAYICCAWVYAEYNMPVSYFTKFTRDGKDF